MKVGDTYGSSKSPGPNICTYSAPRGSFTLLGILVFAEAVVEAFLEAHKRSAAPCLLSWMNRCTKLVPYRAAYLC